MIRPPKMARDALLVDPRSVTDVELLGVYLLVPGLHGTWTAQELLTRCGGLVTLLHRVRSTVPPMAEIQRNRWVLLKVAGELATRYHRAHSPEALIPIETSGRSPESVLTDLQEEVLTDPGSATHLELLVVMISDRAWPRVAADMLRQARDLQDLFDLLSKGYRASPFTWRATLASSLVAGIEVVRRYQERMRGTPSVDVDLFTPAVLDLVETLLMRSLEDDLDAETLEDSVQRFSQLGRYFHWLAGEDPMGSDS